jgi:hypothetical protein
VAPPGPYPRLSFRRVSVLRPEAFTVCRQLGAIDSLPAAAAKNQLDHCRCRAIVLGCVNKFGDGSVKVMSQQRTISGTGAHC